MYLSLSTIPMEPLLSLWLPILIASALVYGVACLLYMVIPLHSKDFAKLEDEDGVIDALRDQNVRRGQYMLPGANSNEEYSSPEWIEKANRGPVGLIYIMSHGSSMLRPLIFQGFLIIAISITAGYVGSVTLLPGTDYLKVFQVVGAVAFLGHAAGQFNHAIWFGFNWKQTWIRALEGLLYGLLTGGVFGWLWPQ